MQTIGEETRTLPEGYTICVAKRRQTRANGSMMEYCELRAWRDKEAISMRVDNMSVSVLRQYLDLWVREIARHRTNMTAKPTTGCPHPENAQQFVREMAFAGMFIFEALNNGEQRSSESTPKRKKSAARKTDAK